MKKYVDNLKILHLKNFIYGYYKEFMYKIFKTALFRSCLNFISSIFESDFYDYVYCYFAVNSELLPKKE